MKKDIVKVKVDLPANVMAALEDIVKLKKITMTEAIAQAIVNYEFLMSEKQKGFKVLIRKPFNKYLEVIL